MFADKGALIAVKYLSFLPMLTACYAQHAAAGRAFVAIRRAFPA